VSSKSFEGEKMVSHKIEGGQSDLVMGMAGREGINL